MPSCNDQPGLVNDAQGTQRGHQWKYVGPPKFAAPENRSSVAVCHLHDDRHDVSLDIRMILMCTPSSALQRSAVRIVLIVGFH